MSKIGKKNIIIPKESSIKIEGANLTITGPKGSKTLTVNDKIFSSKLNENEFQILPLNKKIDTKTSIMWGTYRSLINNAVKGVSKGHEKVLELNGVGFRANIKGENLIKGIQLEGLRVIGDPNKFAKKYNIEIRQVIMNKETQKDVETEAYVEEGVLINSGKFNFT